MKKTLPLFLSFVVFAACSSPVSEPVEEVAEENVTSSVDLNANDFAPPTEAERGHPTDGPYEQRLLSATSTDGVTWEKTNELIVEQASASDMTYKDGVIYLYYVGSNFDGREEGIAAAVSQDNGNTWTFKRVAINGFEEVKSTLGDPDVMLLDDGSTRMYFTAQTPNRKSPSIFYAESADGFNFDYQGEAFYADGYTTIDSSAFRVNGTWGMLTFSGFGTEVIHAQSKDEGKSFEFVKAEDVKYKNQPMFLSNPLSLPDGSVRFYAFDLRSGFRSFVSTDGLTWTDEGYEILKLDPSSSMERDYIKDASITQLDDGSYFMAYGTRIPE